MSYFSHKLPLHHDKLKATNQQHSLLESIHLSLYLSIYLAMFSTIILFVINLSMYLNALLVLKFEYAV